MVTPEKKSLSLGKKDTTPEKVGSSSKLGPSGGMTHSHQTHGKLSS